MGIHGEPVVTQEAREDALRAKVIIKNLINKYRIPLEMMKPLTFDQEGKSSTLKFENGCTEAEIKQADASQLVWLKNRKKF